MRNVFKPVCTDKGGSYCECIWFCWNNKDVYELLDSGLQMMDFHDCTTSLKRLKDISTPDFSTPTFNPRPFNPRLFNHELFNPMVQKFMAEKLGWSLGLKSLGLRCPSTFSNLWYNRGNPSIAILYPTTHRHLYCSNRTKYIHNSCPLCRYRLV